jgi:hypothetical protein
MAADAARRGLTLTRFGMPLIEEVQSRAEQCSAVQCSAVQCGVVQYSTVQYCTVQWDGVEVNVKLSHIVVYCVVWCRVVRSMAIAVLCRVVR